MDTSRFTAWNWAGIVVQMIAGFLLGLGVPALWLALSMIVLLSLGSPLLFLIFFGPVLIGGALSYGLLCGLSGPTIAIMPDAPPRTEKDLRIARASSFVAFLIAGLANSLPQYWW